MPQSESDILEEEKETTAQQAINRLSNTAHLTPWQYKKGQSGNPKGRKSKGESLKEYAKRKMANMTPSQKEEFMNGLDKRTVWEMAEGKPANEITGKDGGAILIAGVEIKVRK